MKAYSLDLRTRILNACKDGLPQREVGRRFQVSEATIRRYRTQERQTGSIAPKTSPGRPRAIPAAAEPALVAQLERTPDAYLAEHCAEWAAREQVTVSVATMGRSIARVGWPLKKRRSSPVNKTRRNALRGGRSSPP